MDSARVNNTTKVPYRWTAYLEATWKDGSVTTGTAFMVGINSAVTAAHNVYNTNKGGYAKKVLFWPGRNGNATPYSGSHVKKIYVPKIYKSENQSPVFINFSHDNHKLLSDIFLFLTASQDKNIFYS